MESNFSFMTHKSGKFSFSSAHDVELVRKKTWEAESLFRSFIELPILPKLASRLDEETIIKSVHGTAAIEGNPLSEDEVGEIIKSGKAETQFEESKQRSLQEIINLKFAYVILTDAKAGQDRFEITEDFIRRINSLITANINYELHEPGKYRNTPVKVGHSNYGGVYSPPKCLKDIKDLMNFFVSWINAEEIMNLGPMVRAALAHYHFATIHPFGNGNGRTARLLEAAILSAGGMLYAPKMLSNYYYRNMEDYFRSFRLVQKSRISDMTPFLIFYLNGMLESLRAIKESVLSDIRILALKDYCDTLRRDKILTKRQRDFLKLLLNMHKKVIFNAKNLPATSPFDLLYRQVTYNTAKNDINRLLGLNLIEPVEHGYRINLYALDGDRRPNKP